MSSAFIVSGRDIVSGRLRSCASCTLIAIKTAREVEATLINSREVSTFDFIKGARIFVVKTSVAPEMFSPVILDPAVGSVGGFLVFVVDVMV